MKIQIILTYSNFFNEPPKEPVEYLKELPSAMVLKMLAVINSMLYLQDDSIKKQVEIISHLLRGQSVKNRNQIINEYIRQIKVNPKEDVLVFNRLTTLQFMNYVLSKPFDWNLIEETNKSQEIGFFKAYLCLSEKYQSEVKEQLNWRKQNRDVQIFRRFAWSMMGQFSLSRAYNLLCGLIKNICMINTLQEEYLTRKYVDSYYRNVGFTSLWQIVQSIMDVMTVVWNSIDEKGQAIPGVQIDKTLELFFNAISLVPDLNPDAKNLNIKEFPLKFERPGKYIVLDWNFFFNKIHDGFIFDFYKHSGISKEQRFKKFIDFKKFTSEQVIERFLFKKLISSYFPKSAVILFDEDFDKVFPDAYVRIGKYVYLFEIKDALFPQRIIDSKDLEKITSELDLKFNSEKKGTGQLIKQLIKLGKEGFEVRSIESYSIKKRNLTIFPVMVYTDLSYQCPGFGYYLNEEFQKRVELNRAEIPGQIKKLSFISLDYLIEKYVDFEANRKELQFLLKMHDRNLVSREKKNRTNPSRKNLESLNEPFEYIAQKIVGEPKKKISEEQFRNFGLYQGLSE